MKREIFTKDWLELHPYKKADAVDQYYTNLANRIYEILYISLFVDCFDDTKDAKHLALCIAAYFEDVISELGIWAAFTTECTRRYKKYVPFYCTGGDYYQDDINIEDIEFLLWHHFQQSCFDTEAIAPFFRELDAAAPEIFDLLVSEFEKAPINERMVAFLCASPTSEKHFYDYRKVLEWFHYSCYFNVGNKERFLDYLKKDMRSDNEHSDIMRYSVQIEHMMGSRRNLLALSSAEWLAKISKQHRAHKLWTNIDFRNARFFSVEKEDQENIYVKDLFLDDILKVTKESLTLDNFDRFINGKELIVTTLFKFGNAWWQNGALVSYPQDKGLAKKVKEEKDKFFHTNDIRNYSLIKNTGNAHKILFLKSNQELLALYHSAGYKMAPGLDFPDTDEDGVVVSGSPYTGMNMAYHIAYCIYSKKNPFYNPAKAEDGAIDIITGNGHVFPYEIVCHLIDKHMLPDANIFPKIYDNKELAIRITQENLQFLADYHLIGRRDKDLSPKELW